MSKTRGRRCQKHKPFPDIIRRGGTLVDSSPIYVDGGERRGMCDSRKSMPRSHLPTRIPTVWVGSGLDNSPTPSFPGKKHPSAASDQKGSLRLRRKGEGKEDSRVKKDLDEENAINLPPASFVCPLPFLQTSSLHSPSLPFFPRRRKQEHSLLQDLRRRREEKYNYKVISGLEKVIRVSCSTFLAL